MSALTPLEHSLNKMLVDEGPSLPQKYKKLIVQWLPYIALLFGVLTAISWWGLWSWGHVGQTEIEFAKEYAQTYNTDPYIPSRMSLAVWAGLCLLGLETLLYYLAFTPLKAHKKSGWNYLFYAGIANMAYSFFLLFLNHGVASFIWSVVSTAACFYFLFQVRSTYAHGSKSTNKASA